MKGKQDFSHVSLSYISSCYFNQKNADVLVELLRHYSTYSSDLLDRIQFVFVDDGSEPRIVLSEDIDLNILLLRINEDIAWNNGGGRNLGVTFARSDKVLMTDIDHEFPEKTLQYILDMNSLGSSVYKFERKQKNGDKNYQHINTFLISRGLFMRNYGYDEVFSGHYGYEDTMFMHYLKHAKAKIKNLNEKYFVKMRDSSLGKNYHTLSRNLSFNKKIYKEKKKKIAKFGLEYSHSRCFLCFGWDCVLDRTRNIKYKPKKQPFWKFW